ncbi:hypothetical protein SF83666_c20660 [Sinorhizobium fredii CCBAU 83666]|nr:hypothetical protein SF83666_c20660 [Sinorhizobium fredii CCBAU 83666]
MANANVLMGGFLPQSDEVRAKPRSRRFANEGGYTRNRFQVRE